MPPHLNARQAAIVAVVLAAVLPYVPTLDNYFAQDDFGVVGLLASKPALYFPRWFVVPWMENIWGYTPDELRPFVALTYQAAAQWNSTRPGWQSIEMLQATDPGPTSSVEPHE